VVLFSVGAAIFTTFVVGVLPALRMVRPNLVTDLKEGGRGVSLGRGGQRLQAGLVVAQVALCFALLVGANLMVQSFLAMQTTSLGFDHKPILGGAGYIAGDAYNDLRARSAVLQQGRRHAPRVAGCVGRRAHDRHAWRRRRRRPAARDRRAHRA
jgi:hypothetical protein